MERLGFCYKCGEYKEVRDHHAYGYETDETLPYCQSCDRKAHNKARREGRCNLSGEESHKKTSNSYQRRSTKHMKLSSETVSPNIQLFQKLRINLNTGTITISSCFSGNNGNKLKVIDELTQASPDSYQFV